MVSDDPEFSPRKQAVILFGSISLFCIYKLKIFAEPDYNNLALIFSIIAFLWFVSILWRWLFCTNKSKDPLSKLPKIKVPHCIKCVIKHNKCETGDINIWNVIHLVLYIVVGYFVPDRYLVILYISILNELIEIGTGNTAKLVIDPLTNLLGYFIGSNLSPYKFNLTI
jgi:hypothetical protein